MKVSSACRGECVAIGGLCHGGGGDTGVVWGFREGRCDLSSGLSQPGGKSC